MVPILAENALAAAEAAGATLVFPGNVYVYGRLDLGSSRKTIRRNRTR